MNFVEYINWLFCGAVFHHRKCSTCMGSDGNCDKCDELTKNLYKRDWKRWHQVKWFDKF